MSLLARLPAPWTKPDLPAPERSDREDEMFRLRFRCAALEKQLQVAAENERLFQRSLAENEALEDRLRAAAEDRAKLAEILGQVAASCRDFMGC